jgi:hypothetical protein
VPLWLANVADVTNHDITQVLLPLLSAYTLSLIIFIFTSIITCMGRDYYYIELRDGFYVLVPATR